jgi:hypothetical protein
LLRIVGQSRLLFGLMCADTKWVSSWAMWWWWWWWWVCGWWC